MSWTIWAKAGKLRRIDLVAVFFCMVPALSGGTARTATIFFPCHSAPEPRQPEDSLWDGSVPKPSSIVWKTSRNTFPLCGKTPETAFHCVENFFAPFSAVPGWPGGLLAAPSRLLFRFPSVTPIPSWPSARRFVVSTGDHAPFQKQFKRKLKIQLAIYAQECHGSPVRNPRAPL